MRLNRPKMTLLGAWNAKLMTKIELHRRLSNVLQSSYHTHRSILRIYWQLSERVPDEANQEILQVLANVAARRAARCVLRLQRLGVTCLPARETFVECLWRWLLLRCGIRFALAWTNWLEQRDRRHYWLLLHDANDHFSHVNQI